jgi:hypothetical protein
LIASLNEGEAREKGETAGGDTVDSAGEELEVGGDIDRWGRPGSEWEREEGELGRAGFVGRKRRWAGGEGEKRKRRRRAAGWAERRGERGIGKFFFNFCLNFSNFQTINSFQSLNTSNLLQVFKLF